MTERESCSQAYNVEQDSRFSHHGAIEAERINLNRSCSRISRCAPLESAEASAQAAPSFRARFARTGGLGTRRLVLDTELLGHEIKRAPLHLLVHASQILANDAER